MKRCRITCVAPPSPPPDASVRYPLINGIPADFENVRVSVVDDDGNEELIPGVRAITWSVRADGEPAVAVLEVLAELHAEARNVSVDIVVDASPSEDTCTSTATPSSPLTGSPSQAPRP